MRILVSNDDGVLAPGLLILANSLSKIADVTVVAPDRNRSGASNSLTLQHPLRVQRLENGFYSVEGTPTDCVHLALTGLLDHRPDMVVSGINAGANLGDDVFYSGTVAAAMEGQFLGLPALAVSLVSQNHNSLQHYLSAAEISNLLVLKLCAEGLPGKTILNVNVPDLPLKQIKGFAVSRLGTRHAAEKIIADVDPRGHAIYWIGAPGPEQDAGIGTDFYAVNHGLVSLTPLRLDLTDYPTSVHLGSWVDTLKL